MHGIEDKPKKTEGVMLYSREIMKDKEDLILEKKEFPAGTIGTDSIKEKEAVNHPLHYGGDTPYECIKVLKAWVSDEEYKGFLRCNAIKYLCRTGKKDETVQELKKAKFYIEKYIEFIEEHNNVCK